MVRQLKLEFQAQKKKVTLDAYFSTKAEVQMCTSELERLLIEASVRMLDSESHALAKCFTLSVPSLQFHIHPY